MEYLVFYLKLYKKVEILIITNLCIAKHLVKSVRIHNWIIMSLINSNWLVNWILRFLFSVLIIKEVSDHSHITALEHRIKINRIICLETIKILIINSQKISKILVILQCLESIKIIIQWWKTQVKYSFMSLKETMKICISKIHNKEVIVDLHLHLEMKCIFRIHLLGVLPQINPKRIIILTMVIKVWWLDQVKIMEAFMKMYLTDHIL